VSMREFHCFSVALSVLRSILRDAEASSSPAPTDSGERAPVSRKNAGTTAPRMPIGSQPGSRKVGAGALRVNARRARANPRQQRVRA
jgi:hypothetical protein